MGSSLDLATTVVRNMLSSSDIFEGSALIEGIKEGSFDSREGEIKDM